MRRPQIEAGVAEEPNGRSQRFKLPSTPEIRIFLRINDAWISFTISLMGILVDGDRSCRLFADEISAVTELSRGVTSRGGWCLIYSDRRNVSPFDNLARKVVIQR
jgi:hypothetical protein